MPTYNKLPLSISDQVSLLESRGLRVPDRAEAKHYLSHIGYYRLRAYWLPLEDSSTTNDHTFRPGASFQEVLDLYVFDRELRLLVLDAIERVEVSFRTAFAHGLAMAHGSHAHLDVTLFGEDYRDCLGQLRTEVTRSKETFILHYQQAYTDPSLPPIWAVSEVMSFGLLSRWFKDISTPQTKKAIAATWGLGDPVVESFIHHLTVVRNMCAHHSRLWNRQFAVKMMQPKTPNELARRMNPGCVRQLYNTLIMLDWVLDIISPDHTWTDRLKDLLGTLPANFDPSQMGFPDGWRDCEPWASVCQP